MYLYKFIFNEIQDKTYTFVLSFLCQYLKQKNSTTHKFQELLLVVKQTKLKVVFVTRTNAQKREINSFKNGPIKIL